MIEKVQRVGPPHVSQGTVPQGPASGEAADFVNALEQAKAHAPAPAHAPVRFSAHAQQRLAAVHLDLHAMNRLEAAVEKAGLKGGKESLILLDDLAFVVSVKNRTVITAVGADRMADNVFTNIDSVVIARDSA
jgi:flagellar operon protein